MKNVTIRLDPITAHWIRIFAAERNTSVSHVVGEILAEKMKTARAYEAAKRDYFSRGATVLTGPGEKVPQRADVYDRTNLRR